VSAGLVSAAGVAGGLGLVLLVLARGVAWRLAGLAGWALGWAGLALWLAPVGHAGEYAAIAGAGLAAAVLLAVLFLGAPWLLALAVVASVPVRIAVSVGPAGGKLPVPLYLVAAGAALALAWQLFWEDGRGRELGLLAWPLALLAGWSGIALAWSVDRRQGAVQLVLAVLPLALIAVALSRLPWRPGWAGALYVELAGIACVLAAVGGWQYLTRSFASSTRLEVGNAYVPVSWFYRVGPAFAGPDLYARFLVVAILAGVVLLLFGGRAAAWGALAAILVTFAGLVPSFSQSAYVALAAGIAAALLAAWGWRSALWLLLGAAAVAAVLLVPQARHRVLGDHGVRHAASARRPVVSNGIRLARDHPFAGVGTGGFGRAYDDRFGAGRERLAARDAPVTTAVELGAPGLLALAWLAGAALLVAFRRRPDDGARRARLAIGLGVLAILVQSLLDDALLADPLFWALLGLLAASAAGRAAALPLTRPRRDRFVPFPVREDVLVGPP
jgi:hypothetical protein